MLREAPRYYRQETELLDPMEEVRRFGTTAVIDAHPDDLKFLAGGVVAEAAKYNAVYPITATKGEKGGEVHGWEDEQTAKKREEEQLAGLEILGIPKHHQHWLGYTDGELTDVDPQEAIKRIGEYIRDIEAETVITFAPDGVTGHPDHRTMHGLTTEAFNRYALPKSKLLYIAMPRQWAFGQEKQILDRMNFFYPGYPTIQPYSGRELHVTLEQDMQKRKIEAVMAHESQYAHVIPTLPPDTVSTILSRERLVIAQTVPAKSEHVVFQNDNHAA